MESRNIRIGITQGDINGIGYEVILKVFSDLRISELCTPIIYGSSKLAAYHRKVMDLSTVNFNVISHVSEALENNVNIINVTSDDVHVSLGESTNEAGRASLEALVAAVDDLQKGSLDALVTAPINKKNVHCEEFQFMGHTGFLNHCFGNREHNALMLLVSGSFRVAVVTEHIPISDVSKVLSEDLIYTKLKTLNFTLQRDFGIEQPRIAVLGLNPHSGDLGLIGREEYDVIIPAIQRAKSSRISAFGPFPADGFFGSGYYDRFDAVLAMYHDQGLIPFKTISMSSGVNFTAGLPIIRTSPDHGTAYEIVGKGIADETSFRNAIYLAIDVWRNRFSYDECTANPLKHQYHNRGNDNVKLDFTKEGIPN